MINQKIKKSKKFKRIFYILRTIKSYDLIEFLPGFYANKKIIFLSKLFFWVPKKEKEKSRGERLRLAFEELGPIWIKFGQMLSTRRDLFDEQTANELTKLQDCVSPFSGKIAQKIIETALGGNIEQFFIDFSSIPIASASIAQVHAAKLINSQREIIIKVRRPNILDSIQEDLNLMHFFAKKLLEFYPELHRFRLQNIVNDYEKTLSAELNLRREAENTIKLRNNFLQSKFLYIPEVFLEFCHETILVEEKIEGIPISDLETLKSWGTNLQLLAERGVEIFFTQVFRDNFFHADMHPGNIFVDITEPANPKYIGIDCAVIGSLSQDDRTYLAENFIAFFKRDYQRIADLYIESGWVPISTDRFEFENAMRTVCEPIFEKPLAEISFANILLELFKTARKFDMEIQPQLILLQKTLLYVEGLGRQIYPQLDLWKTAKPFLENWMKEQKSIKKFAKSIKENLLNWQEFVPELPSIIVQNLNQSKISRLQIERLQQTILEEQQRNRRKINQLFLLFFVFFLVFICYVLFR